MNAHLSLDRHPALARLADPSLLRERGYIEGRWIAAPPRNPMRFAIRQRERGSPGSRVSAPMTLLPEEALIMREETFGPVAAVAPFETEALARIASGE